MELNQYQQLAMRTDSQYKNCKDRLLNGIMGLNGEAGETIDIVKKHLFQGHEFDRYELAEELGDILWYIALCADAIDIPMDEIAEQNIAKLMRRYPEGFKESDSVNRDIYPLSIMIKMSGFKNIREFAYKLGVHDSAVNHWISGRRIISKNNLKHAALILNMTPEEVEHSINKEKRLRHEAKRNRKD